MTDIWVNGQQRPMTAAEEANLVAKRAARVAKKASRDSDAAAKQARKDDFKAQNDNKPVTVGDLRQILEDAGVI